MPSDESFYEVCFTVSPDSRINQITFVRPDHIFYGVKQEDLVFKVKANGEEEAEEKAVKMLASPDNPYIQKYGQGIEVKTKYIRKIIYM